MAYANDSIFVLQRLMTTLPLLSICAQSAAKDHLKELKTPNHKKMMSRTSQIMRQCPVYIYYYQIAYSDRKETHRHAYQ